MLLAAPALRAQIAADSATNVNTIITEPAKF